MGLDPRASPELSDPTMSKTWLLIQTKPKDENRAAAHLQAQGANTYCPQIQVEKIIRSKRITKTEPLFPGYIFVQDQGSLSYTTIRSTRGVAKIVRFGADYTLLPNTLIETIRIKEKGLTPSEADTYLHCAAPNSGDKVQIIKGPFQGLEAIYYQPDGQIRSMVFIQILHQQILASVENAAFV